MDRFWQWAWDRHGARYSWVCFVFTFAALLPLYLLWSLVVLAYEHSDRQVEVAAYTVVAGLVLAYLVVLPGLDGMRLVERWAAGDNVDPARALESTYIYGRRTVVRTVVG
ncbi:MAG: adenylate/guanylate cyclase domain-containing protein, partial [Mycobacterium sp.]|nr:adenylate/guanylate cyclase domain-containing protein [Mycobacterium sp.]